MKPDEWFQDELLKSQEYSDVVLEADRQGVLNLPFRTYQHLSRNGTPAPKTHHAAAPTRATYAPAITFEAAARVYGVTKSQYAHFERKLRSQYGMRDYGIVPGVHD